MATANSLEEYRAIQKRRIMKLRQGKRRGPITAAKYMAAQMRSLAPRSSGNLVRSIKRRKNKVEVRGSNKYNGFPYIHWINATPGIGLDKVAYKKRWGDKKKYSYAEVSNKTGTPGFYFKSLRNTRRFFRQAMLDAFRKSLRAEF